MIQKHILYAFTFVLVLCMNSCYVCKFPEPLADGKVKGVLKLQPKYIPNIVCDTPCDWTEPLRTTLYVTTKQPYYCGGPLPVIIDSITSNALGEFEKQLPEGFYSLFVTYQNEKYKSPIWLQSPIGFQYAFSFYVKLGEVTTIRPVVYAGECGTNK